MNKEEIIEKLKSLGITTENAYPKSSFKATHKDLSEGTICIGCFASELREDFYFYNTFDKKIYTLPADIHLVNMYPTEEFRGKTKYLVDLRHAQIVWEDKPYEEIPDEAYNTMTLRQYACIQLRVPETNIPWLDAIIKKSKE